MNNFNDLEKNFDFGQLNKFDPKYGGGKKIGSSNNLSYNEAINLVIEDKFKPDALSSISEYIGYVLYNRQENIESYFNFADIISRKLSNSPRARVNIIVRIPELHTVLPIPDNDNDIDIIGMYPSFSGADVILPGIGDLVRVKFTNIYNQTDGIYIGPYDSGGIVLNTTTGATSVAIVTDASNQKETDADKIPLSLTDPSYNEKIKELAKEYYFAEGKAAKNISNFQKPNFIEREITFNFQRRPLPVNTLVIHESTGDRVIELENALLKNGTGVHFCIDILGNIFSYNDPLVQVYHASACNPRSIGIEVLTAVRQGNMDSGLTQANIDLFNQKNINIEEFKKVRSNRTVLLGDEAAFTSPSPTVYERVNGKKTTKVLQHSFNSFVVPPLKQLEATYQVARYVCGKYNIPVSFPGTSIKNHTFKWTVDKKCKDGTGIMSHHQFGDHSDGTFILHYVLCRFNDYSKEESLNLTLKAAKIVKQNRNQPIPRPGNTVSKVESSSQSKSKTVWNNNIVTKKVPGLPSWVLK